MAIRAPDGANNDDDNDIGNGDNDMDEDLYWEFQENIKPILLRSPTKSKTNITFRPSPQNTIINIYSTPRINSIIFYFANI